MEERDERLAGVAGLVAVAAVGAATVIATLAGPGSPIRGAAPVWVAAYLAYLAAFVFDTGSAGRFGRRATVAVFAVELVAGVVVFALAPEGWTAILFVVTAASAAFWLPPRGVAAVVALQTLVIAVVLPSAGWETPFVVLNTMAYASFQGFAALVAFGQRKEAEAARQLAAAHAELRAATALLASSARTAERLRISRDLHDVVGHQLTAMALELEVAAHHADGQAAGHVERARGLAKDLLRDVRAAVGEMRVAEDGLEPALRELVAGIPGLRVDLAVEDGLPLDEARAMVLVRCVQEIVTNTLRHAGAQRLEIRVTADGGAVRLTTRDDGHGAPALVPGNGLVGLRERIEELGGQVAFEPRRRGRPGEDGGFGGFAVTATVPAP